MPRTVSKWIGKTDDAKPPPRVRLRVFERYGGVCQISGRKIRAGDPWDLDHTIALINGGKNEEDNLRPVLKDEHKAKTADDIAEKAKVDRMRKKHLGIRKPKGRPLPGTKASGWKHKMSGEWVRR
ncbi:MAG: HNH endonuclease [Roseibium sp.]|nr:HNH endonuclease [Roseibium sp.]